MIPTSHSAYLAGTESREAAHKAIFEKERNEVVGVICAFVAATMILPLSLGICSFVAELGLRKAEFFVKENFDEGARSARTVVEPLSRPRLREMRPRIKPQLP